VADVLPIFAGGWGALGYGVVLAFLVGIVIIGGIRRIGQVAGFIVPLMCGIYLVAGLFIIVTNYDQIGSALGKIFGAAFTPKAGFGGMLGVLVTGFRRAAFSNEAGVGSASIAHSAAATDEPVREGIVALLEPFIDTIVVCTMTGLVVVITGAYESGGEEGVLMTSKAFATVLPWFPRVLSLAVFLFAFSTMISWSYYGERCWTFLFGAQFSIVYKVLFLAFVVLGSVLKLGNVIDFSDLMILGMSFPNILGAVLLSGKVSDALKSYWGRYKSGQMRPTR
jgi:AGCS family alanine or glycine:cation symporter